MEVGVEMGVENCVENGMENGVENGVENGLFLFCYQNGEPAARLKHHKLALEIAPEHRFS